MQEVKQEINEAQEDGIRERQEHERVQEELTREIKLRMLILENFVPSEERKKLERRAYFDEEAEVWCLRPIICSKGDSATDSE